MTHVQHIEQEGLQPGRNLLGIKMQSQHVVKTSQQRKAKERKTDMYLYANIICLNVDCSSSLLIQQGDNFD